MVTIRAEISSDTGKREALLDAAFGMQRFRKTCETLRRGRLPADGLAFSAVGAQGKLVGTVRLWDITAGSAGPALLLGPSAVAQAARGQGAGAALLERALAVARQRGHSAVLLVGDAPYYERFGFANGLTRTLHLPGPVARDRFLALELVPGALDGAEGLVAAAGAWAEVARKAA